MQKSLERRRFLRWSLGGIATAVVAGQARAADLCQPTPEQDKGPFYPLTEILPVNDLTRVAGAKTPALGQVVYVRGIVRDAECNPLEGVNVEIWQACASGKYDHPSDPNPAPLDPNFRYWGETFTNANGEYEFKTIIPGSYPAGRDWVRPPHIHFRVVKLGFRELITQMYFKGDSLNDKDFILINDVPESQRDSVVIEFTPRVEEPLTLEGQFDLTLTKIR